MSRNFQALVRVLCGALVAWSVCTAGAPLEAAEDDYGRLYETARQARQDGDFKSAAAALERALAMRPNSVDALYLLGMVLAYQDRNPEALAKLRRARELDPANDDVRLGLARVLGWSGETGAAEREVSVVLERRPENSEARLLKARFAYYQGHLAAAEETLVAILEREAESLEALELMGDVKMAAGETQIARDFYRRALDIAPNSPGIGRKLDQSRPMPWRFDTGYSYSNFSRENRDDWHEGFVQLRYGITPETGLLGRVEVSHRFDEEDVVLAAGADHRLTEWLSGYLLFGGTPDADFREDWFISGGASARLWPDLGDLGATLLTLDTKRSSYDTGEVDTISPGLQQYLYAGRIWLTGRWINTFNEDNDWTTGWLARLDWQAAEELLLNIGAADAGETVAGETVDTRSYFAGVVVDLPSGRGLRFDYLYEDREGSYIRHSFGLGFSQRF
ncbi:MAG: YaiO family outer membrane beta-barrel protein [Rhodospirillales bacterium]|nr:YaiO family outer membrane beta-barrel protein [Rhodospirillales bacterium]